MRAVCITTHDPFNPALHRKIQQVTRRTRIRALAPRTQQPHICLLNGKALLRAGWRRRLKDGDVVAFVALPQGGGDGSNVLAAVAMIVVTIFAPYASGVMAGAGPGFTAAVQAGLQGTAALVTAGIQMVGAMLINALVPPPKMPAAMNMPSPSPTYSLGAQGNSARIGQPVPVVYGRHLIYPDFAAQPYTEFAGNEQYLYQLLAIGQGHYDIEAIRIEDTPISSFEEIDVEVVPPGEAVTLFPTNVVNSIEISGQEINHGSYLGPFVALAEGDQASELAFDIVLPRGLYYANDKGGLNQVEVKFRLEAQRIDDEGNAQGDWIDLGEQTVKAATTTPIRQSYRMTVPLGRYQCRVTRTTAKNNSTRVGNDLSWAGLRAYLPGNQRYGDITLVAMRMRATNNLSQQASRKVNLIVQRKLPVWSPDSGWSEPQPTRNPAWALADIARAKYGARLADIRVNLEALYQLSKVWDERRDRFDMVFDSQSTVWEALQLAARSGRAQPFIQGGVLSTFRDGPVELPVAMFSPRNMLRGSFDINYKMASEDMADSIDIEYLDDQVWSWRTVRAALPGSAERQTYTFRLMGVTSRQQAWQEGMYMAACNRYRRRFPKWTTEMEGFIPALGDLMTVTHDMPRWGQFAEAVSFDPGTKQLAVTEPLDWSADGVHYLSFRRRDGSPAGPFRCARHNDPRRVELLDWHPTSDPLPDTGMERERSHVAFGPADAHSIRVRCLSVRPASLTTVALDTVVESDYVHIADRGVAPGAEAWQLPTQNTAPRITGLTARSMPEQPDKMILSWQPAPGADRYLIEQSVDGNEWTRCGETSASNFSCVALYGADTLVRVAAEGLTRGPWVVTLYGQSADYMWAPADSMLWAPGTQKAWR